MIRTVATKPFADQRPGTSGLRKKVAVFQAAALSRELRSVDLSTRSRAFRARRWSSAATAAIFNREAIQIVIKIAAANGFGRIVVGQGGILSTPAVSALIRTPRPSAASSSRRATTPAGRGDFGIKYNIGNGGPAPEKLTDAIFARTKTISRLQDPRRARRRPRHDSARSRSGGMRSRSSIRSPTMPR